MLLVNLISLAFTTNSPLFPPTTNFALIVIDMQNKFSASGSPAGIAEAVATVEHMRKYAASGRAHVFYTQHGYLNGTTCDGHHEYKRHNDARNDTTECELDTVGTRGFALIDELSPLASEPVIRKEQFDAFFATSLHAMLQERAVDTVVLVGWMTNVCVAGTARGAFARDYRVVVLSDATGTADGPGTQAATLRTIDEIVADVMPAARFRREMERALTAGPTNRGWWWWW